MKIRKYKQSDCKTLADLFYHTVHTVNAKDYTKEQLNAWATGQVDLEKWDRSLQEHETLVAVDGETIIGFGDMDLSGYLDRLYVHIDYQGQGVATAICDQLEEMVRGKITTHASITAKPFFEKRGYKVKKEQQVERQGIFLTNYVMEKYTASYHLPGLFEFYDFYRVFLPLFREYREYFYDWCEISSIYGAPAECIWGGGRIGGGDASPEEVLALMEEYGISARLTFSNSLLTKEHLEDKTCNALCAVFEDKKEKRNGVIVHSDVLLDYLRERYPGFYFVSSTTKVLTEFSQLLNEVDREEFRYVVPDFRLNKGVENWKKLSPAQKEKAEFLCNECCYFECRDRKRCYEAVSRKNLGEKGVVHHCAAPHAGEGYRFSKAMENPGFISLDDIKKVYLPMGFSNFKLEGRGLGSALLLEFLLYYMTKPEYHIHVREKIYLDNMLDLF